MTSRPLFHFGKISMQSVYITKRHVNSAPRLFLSLIVSHRPQAQNSQSFLKSHNAYCYKLRDYNLMCYLMFSEAIL